MYSCLDDLIYILGFINFDHLYCSYSYKDSIIYKYNNSAIWTRNLHAKTGFRHIVLLMDLIYHKQYKSFNKPSYQLLELIIPVDHQM